MTPQMLTAHDDCKVYTPGPLAEAMAGVLPNRPDDRWLEPCVGEGIFLSALARCGVAPEQVTAVELDRHDGLTEKCGNYHPGEDFLDWSLRTAERFDRIIGNPPYLPLHRVPEAVRAAALRISRPSGGFVPPKANCWYAFMCASLRLLRPGGGLCFVLPSGWEYADYAADIRECVPELFARFEVIRSETSFFKGILDGCVVMVADGFKQPAAVRRRSDHASLDDVIAYLRMPPLPCETKSVNSAIGPSSKVWRAPRLVRFGDVARVRIGAVTGDVGFFLMNESRRIEQGLPPYAVRPVLTRARHLVKATVTSGDWNALLEVGERVWLFWLPVRPGRRPNAVSEYLRSGEEAGLPLREKIRVRSPWYRTRIPPPADGFMSGMTPAGPWISLNQMDGLTATNTLYTVHFTRPIEMCEKAAWSLALMCSTVTAQHAKFGRRYSDGLLKFEPKDVMSLMVPTPVDKGPAAMRVYQNVVDKMIGGDVELARSMSDVFVLEGSSP